MRHKLIFLCLLIAVISSVCEDFNSSAAASLSFIPRGRAIREWNVPPNSKEEVDHYLKVAGPEKKSKRKENSMETENSSNMDSEDIVYNIDYHGATTHPTPTPKHPKP